MGKSNLLLKLECPVCKRYMRPPIHMCEVGHSVCKECAVKLNSCAICRLALPRNNPNRNFLVESMCEEISYPCSYREQGCTYYQKLEVLKKHETELCALRPLPCPIANNNNTPCGWVGYFDALKVHLEQNHKKHIIHEVTELEFYHNTQTPIFFMYCFGKLFQVCHQKGVFHVHMMGPRREAVNYRYVFTLFDSRHNFFELKIENSCNERCNKEDVGAVQINIPTFKHGYEYVKCKVVIKKVSDAE